MSQTPNPETQTPAAGEVRRCRINRANVLRMFPHAPLLFRELNRRYASILGRLITPPQLYGVMRGLGDIPPEIFLGFLDRQGYGVLKNRRTYEHFPNLARRCAILERAKREGAA